MKRQPAADVSASPACAPTGEYIVLYDGGCPLCLREITHYRKLRALRPIRWIDLAATADDVVIDGISREAALRLFHVRDHSGRWHIGASGFIALWRALPGYRYLAATCRGLRLAGPLDLAYRRFARWRLRRRCDAGSCGIAPTPNETKTFSGKTFPGEL
jgi:predicted DCC family thiol-disulfide oxidoreductase YuxK